MPRKTKVKHTALEWCKQQHALGKELKLCWEGGGDSGWVYFRLDGEEFNNEFTEELTNRMYDELDYGSWAGEFSAVGEAVFNPDENAFIGEDAYSEDETVSIPFNHKIEIPNNLWFHHLNIHIEDEGDGGALDAIVEFRVENGFVTGEHLTFENKLKEDLKATIINVTSQDGFDINSYRSMWHDFRIDFAEFEKSENHVTYVIEEVNATFSDETLKSICLIVEEEN